MAEVDRAARVAREVFFVSIASTRPGHRVLDWAFNRFVGSLEDVFLAAGDTVYREGDIAQEHYFVVTGAVRLTRESEKGRTVGERSAIGALDMALERPHTRTAVATTTTHLLKMRADDWWALLEVRLDLAHRIILSFANEARALRLRSAPLGGFEEPSATPPPLGAFTDSHLVARILLLRAVPLFARATIQAVATLAEAAREVRAADGEVVFRRGEMNDVLVVVGSGEVVATREEPSLSGRFGPRSLVAGAVGAGLGSPYEVRAVGAARLLVLPEDAYIDAMEEHFSLVRSGIVAVAEEHERLLER
jgi:CRP-like cAMP-binding protein